MKHLQIKEIRRNLLEKILKVNMPHISFNKRTKLSSLRSKLNIVGGDHAFISIDDNFVIKGNNNG